MGAITGDSGEEKRKGGAMGRSYQGDSIVSIFTLIWENRLISKNFFLFQVTFQAIF